MDFVIQWLWYLLGFVAGSGVACLIGTRLIKRAGDKEVTAAEAGAGQ